MRRRRFLASVGGLAATGGMALGSGAFTSVEAERSVLVEVADDDEAFLRLEPIANDGLNEESTGRSLTDGESVGFNIPGVRRGENDASEGVAPDSVYEFYDLLEISNHGTQQVTIQSEYIGEAFNELALVSDSGILSKSPPTLDTGEGIDVGLYIDSHGTETGEYRETLTIIAERVGGNMD